MTSINEEKGTMTQGQDYGASNIRVYFKFSFMSMQEL